MSQEINIHIKKIVLEGFEGMPAAALREHIRAHLLQLIETNGVSGLTSGKVLRIKGGQIELPAPAGPAQSGAGIAAETFKAIHSVQPPS
jgi:hypothetical protein